MSTLQAQFDAAILAGGLGTRLRGVVDDRPKVLAEVLGRPWITYLLDQLAQAGVRRVVLCTGYRAADVEAALGTRHGPLELVYSRENQPLGTGGALRLAASQLDTDPVLVLNGDSLCPANLTELVRRHVARGAEVSLLAAWVDDASRYGRLEFDAQDRLTAFHEKQPDPSPGWINAGVYVVRHRWLSSIPAGTAVSLERDLLPQAVGQGLFVDPRGGALLDIGTPESYARAAAFLQQQALP